MIASWMVYGVVVAVGVGAAALALESVVRGWGPTRWVWASALIVSVGIPAAGMRSVDSSDANGVGLAPADLGSVMVMQELPAQQPGRTPDAGSDLIVELPRIPMAWSRLHAVPGPSGRWAAGVWMLLSGFGLAWMLAAASRLGRRRRTWQRFLVNGRSVLLSANTGPAVVGLLNPEIVLPSWSLELGEPDRELMLRHEEEHRGAGDLWLITAALGLIVLLPWNLPLWWQLRRLRLAVEVDCDHRVLSAHGDVDRYGSLLLDLGLAGRGRGVGASLAFARPMPFLERRIRVMTTRHVFRPLRSLTFVTLTGLLILAACRIESPPTHAPLAAERAPIPGSNELPVRASVAPPPSTLDPGLRGQRPEPPVAPDPSSAPTEIPAPEPGPATRPRSVQEAPPGQEAQEAVELQRLLQEVQEGVRRQERLLRELSRQFEANSESFERLQLLSEQLEAMARRSLGSQLDSAAVQLDRVAEQDRNREEQMVLAQALFQLARRREMLSDSVQTRDLARLEAELVRRQMALRAQEVGRDEVVTGRVLSPDGSTPLAAVSVSVPEFEVGAMTVGGVPNRAGRFLLRGVPPGSRVLVFQHTVYGRWEVEVEVLEEETTVVGDVIAPGG